MSAVKTVKRDGAYREHRRLLSSVAPADVWFDEQERAHFVLFEFKSFNRSQGYLGFAVDVAKQEVVTCGQLSIDLSQEGWLIRSR